jgi:hypothetical protein
MRQPRCLTVSLAVCAAILLTVGCGGGRSGVSGPGDDGSVRADGGDGSGGTAGGGSGGSGSGGRGGSGGTRGTGGSLGSGGGSMDAGPPADAAADGAGGRDGGASDVRDGAVSDAPVTLSCPAAVPEGAASPSGVCTISSASAEVASACGTAAGCPITAAWSLRCQSSGYGPWVVPTGTSAATVMFATGGTHLFTIGPGSTTRVDQLPLATQAIESLAVDRAGTRTVFAGELPGVWRLRETATGWSSDIATVQQGENDLALVSEGRAIDETHAFAAYFDLDDYLPRLVTRDGACWRVTQLGTAPVTSMAMDVDAMNRPWVAWLSNAGGPVALSLAAPDGSVSTPYRSTVNDALSFWDRPVVLAGGLGGQGAFPALATQRLDGLHVVTADASGAVWTDRIVPGSARFSVTPNCPPPPVVVVGGVPCQGMSSCMQHGEGVLPGFGLARTSAGRTYVSWLEVVSDTTFTLTTPSPGCVGVAAAPGDGDGDDPVLPRVAPCMCFATASASTRTLTLAIARVTDTGAPAEAIRHFPLLGGSNQVSSVLPQLFSTVMAARGNTLLVTATVQMAPQADLRYFEIDSAGLP